MFRLFFCQETSERYDIDIYLLLLNSTGAIHFAIGSVWVSGMEYGKFGMVGEKYHKIQK